jgi:hypothetical protein
MGDAKLGAYIDAVVSAAIRPSAQQDVRNALALISKGRWAAFSQPLQLLALRRYLRMQNREHKNIHARWAWSPAEAQRYRGEGLAQALLAAAELVRAKFSRDNAGYRLALSPLRTLERQVSLWNGNLHVRTAATTLSKYILEQLSSKEYGMPPGTDELKNFVPLLQNSTVHPEPTSAAPGTSDHGQLRAVDFVVYHGSALVAGTDSSAIHPVWKAQGWEQKLMAATKNSGLVGPLQHPYEPWHWRLA